MITNKQQPDIVAEEQHATPVTGQPDTSAKGQPDIVTKDQLDAAAK